MLPIQFDATIDYAKVLDITEHFQNGRLSWNHSPARHGVQQNAGGDYFIRRKGFRGMRLRRITNIQDLGDFATLCIHGMELVRPAESCCHRHAASLVSRTELQRLFAGGEEIS